MTIKDGTDDLNELETGRAIRYRLPDRWVQYDREVVFSQLTDARAAVYALTTTPYQRAWVDKLQEIQLKMEVAGTSRIEGADFTENELEAALDPRFATEQLLTRSQRQARAAVTTYRWIANLPEDIPITEDLVREIHAMIVRECDDDHCQPGALRPADFNVTFGMPRHRGCEGGAPCEEAFRRLISAVQQEFSSHDPLIQALAFHYHLAAMHPFMDGNGRTGRAIEALLLRRAGLRDPAFIAMSNYYYDEKDKYLQALAQVRSDAYDLTSFVVFGLRGISIQCKRLFQEIRRNMQKALFRNTMFDLFDRLQSPRKRVLKNRQLSILKVMLRDERLELGELRDKVWESYRSLKSPWHAMVRDLNSLIALRALKVETIDEEPDRRFVLEINLDWPSQITETEFFEVVKKMPRARTHKLLP